MDLSTYIKATSLCKKEKGRRLSPFKWFSRRYVAIYRFIFSQYFNDDSLLEEDKKIAEGLNYVEPFAGAGTGIKEALKLGFDVYFAEINPIAYIFTLTELKGNILNVRTNGLMNLWKINEDEHIVYSLITRDKIPSRVGKKTFICYNCGAIFQDDPQKEKIVCPLCGTEMVNTYKAYYTPNFKTTPINKTWRIFAVYTSKKRFLPPPTDYPSIQITKPDERFYIVLERWRREASVETLYDIFTPRQLYTFQELIKINREALPVILNTAFTANLLSKWYSPLEEVTLPVVGGWIPHYTAETNPISPHARNSVFSKKWKIRENNGYELRKIHPHLNNAIEMRLPNKVNLAVLDPPYIDFFNTYYDKSLPALTIYMEYNRNFDIQSLIRSEIGKDYSHFFQIIRYVVKKLEERNTDLLVFLFNAKYEETWKNLWTSIHPFKPYRIFWFPGESPGRLGRSKIRGIYVIFTRIELDIEKVEIVFNQGLEVAKSFLNIDKDAEERILKILKDSLSDREVLIN